MTQLITNPWMFLLVAGVSWLFSSAPSLRAQPVTLQLSRQTNDIGQLTWNTTSGSLYHLQSSSNLFSGSWTVLAPLVAASNSLRWTDFNPPDPIRFYRVLVPGPQATMIDPARILAYSGAQIFIHGSGLDAGDLVLIGGSLLQSQAFVSPTLLQGGVPNLAPGWYDVQLYDNLGHLVSVLTNAIQIMADAASPALKVEPPGPTPGDPSGGAGSRSAQNDPAGFFLFSGEVHSTATDLIIPGVGMDFVWSRSYRSLIGTNTSQGNGWTYGYNISIRQSDADVMLTDGDSRHDLYFHQPDGTYGRNGFMREGSFDTNGDFVLKFPDTGTWTFYPLDSSPSQGKLAKIQDRNGNSMLFLYDNSYGRLINVVDTLGRTNTLNYDYYGFLSSIVDYSGRVVSYAYYQNGDDGGSAGDLKSVTGPAVTGTPNGNDFPLGKTTTYTYTKGSPDDNLNHKLLTITDPKGQTWMQNTYSTNTNPAALEYRRVVNRILGQTNDIECLSYSAQVPDPTNYFATQKTIVNDRVGNVREYLYDSQNRLVLERDYTGRAAPGVTTTGSDNRPAGKLRAADPDYYETSYQYNIDSLPTVVTYPNGNMTRRYYQSDFDPAASGRTRANLRMEQTLPGPLGGDQAALVSQYEYDTDMGGCCGFNFVTKSTDAQGNITRHTYDSRGNRTRTTYPIPSIVEDFGYNSKGQLTSHVWPDNGSHQRRGDSFLFYTNGPQNGYLQQSVIDATNLALATAYEYDARGNVTRKIDARGHDTLYTVNALNQVVRQLSREVTNQFVSFRYEQDIAYDANDNQTRLDIQNLDDQGFPSTNTPVLTTTYDFDILNRRVRSTQQVDNSHNVVTELDYDANGNQAQARFGLAASGADPINTITTLYDERDLLYQEFHEKGYTNQSTTQFDYDPDGNLVRTSQGLEDIAAPRITTYAYDGYGRRTTVTDAMGNVTTTHYDDAGNAISRRVDGELVDLPGGTNNVRLAETTYTYDALNRLVQTDQAFFDPVTQTNLGTGHALSRTIYSASSQVLQTIDANNHAITIAYDSANRRRTVTDAKGNTTSYSYDANGNVVLVTEVDYSDLGTSAQTFRTTSQYDQMDRLIQTTDNAGNTTRYAYDSRNNQVALTDPRGNLSRYDYDGLNRLTTNTDYLTDSGFGGGNPAGTIVTSQSWDADSRLIGQTDANGNTTTYVYDSLNRQVGTVFADGTTNGAAYDVHGNPTSTADANGIVCSAIFDVLNRLITNHVSRAAGLMGTTFEHYQYDGLSRTLYAQNDDSIVTRSYDSLSSVVRETLQVTSSGAPVRTVACAHDGVGNVLSCTYPGGRIVNNTYDSLDRLQTNSDSSGVIASYKFFGPACVERRDYGNGTRAAFSYDSIRRPTNSTHTVISGGAPIDSRSYAWDAADNQTAMNDLLTSGADTNSAAYDSVDRLVQYNTALAARSYSLDGAGNRLNVTGGTNAGSYARNPVTDLAMNQYTTTPFDSRTYDANGNLVIAAGGSSPPYYWSFGYDYRNRLVSFNNAVGVVGTVKYDCFGRRIEKWANPGTYARYYYADWQELEEQDATNGTAATFVWGNDLDELLNMNRGAQRYFYHEDELGSIRKVTGIHHAIVEQYRYDDYGTPSFFDGGGSAIAGTQVGNATLFTGRRYDPESGLYYYRTRYLEPATGRFTTRDSIGIWGDSLNLGNAYTYVANDPEGAIDPYGEAATFNTSRSNIKDKATVAAAGDGIGGIEMGLKKKPGGQLCAAAAGDGIGGIEMGLKKKPGPQPSAFNTSRSQIMDRNGIAFTGTPQSGLNTEATISVSDQSQVKEKPFKKKKATLAFTGTPQGPVLPFVPTAASINTSRSWIKSKSSMMIIGFPHVPVLPFVPTAASINAASSNLKDKATATAYSKPTNYSSAKSN